MHAHALMHAFGLYSTSGINAFINSVTECSETEGYESAQAEKAVSVISVIMKHNAFIVL